MNIGDKILNLRKEKNMTQEQLANTIGISAGAVCKWETGKSMPDILMLSPLARALETSIDDLLSFKEKLTDLEVRKIKKDLTDIFLYKGYSYGENECRKYLSDYPNNVYLKLQVAELIQMYGMLGLKEDEEEIMKERLEYSLRLLNEVVKSQDSKYVFIALFSIAGIHMMLENYKESEEALKELSNSFIDPMPIYTVVLNAQGKSEEAKTLCEQMLLKYLNNSISMLATLSKVDREVCNKDSLFFLDAICKIEDEFGVGLGSGIYGKCRLFLKNNELKDASIWFKKYVEKLLSTGYDYKNNKYFKDIKLEIDESGQSLIRKNLYKSLINDSDLKILSGIKDYENAIKLLKDNI
ncbi:MAG: helix-turn-helix domain-containing protein [Paraclostridium sordellii]|uniref:helix-turn-helix domain-containing protein n=1 Tax=Paraclostridium sordellii TaxID=1505 RepID=UPI001FADDAFD|nr:helix-turn-helix transcriptional regulator [Paeniclostridium sordellii]